MSLQAQSLALYLMLPHYQIGIRAKFQSSSLQVKLGDYQWLVVDSVMLEVILHHIMYLVLCFFYTSHPSISMVKFNSNRGLEILKTLTCHPYGKQHDGDV